MSERDSPRLSGDLQEGEIEDEWSDEADLEDVETVDEETASDEGPLASDADLGWDQEGLLTDHDEPNRMPPAWRLVFYVGGLLALIAAAALLLAPVLHAL